MNTTKKVMLGLKKKCLWQREREEDEEGVVWPDVTGICGFWDGSCCTTGSGAVMWIKDFLALGWKTCAPVLGVNSSNAEMEGCATMIEITKKLVDKCLS